MGAGAPSLLESEDEEFIANAISSKSTCHERRYETTLFINHRVKKRDFLSLADYSRLRRGTKLIKSATTVTNRGKPRNVRSRVAKSHKGKWLWCTKKPHKTEDHNTECTHHQHGHVHNAKPTMFAEDQREHSVFIRMLKPIYVLGLMWVHGIPRQALFMTLAIPRSKSSYHKMISTFLRSIKHQCHLVYQTTYRED